SRVVEARIENRHVGPFGMVGDDHRVAGTVGKSELLCRLPGILSKHLVHVGAEDGVGAVSDFRIAVEETESGVADCNSSTASTTVGEEELPVLVVGASGTGVDIDLVVVILAGPLELETEFECVVAFDPSKAVADGVNGTRGVRWIGSATESGEG